MMRSVLHPGPIAAPRIEMAQSGGRDIEITLHPDRPLSEAVAESLATEDLESAWLEITDAPVSALDYVIPALAPDDTHVAWYSGVHSFGGTGRIDHLGMIVGRHSGQPFLHGHGLWTAKGAPQAMGHILPERTILSAPVTAQGVGLTGACFDRRPDAETNFACFQVRQTGAPAGEYAAVRLKPNQDFATALDEARTQLGWGSAHAMGLGSLIGARFQDGSVLESLATEFLIRDAVADTDGLEPDIAIVGIDGTQIMRGRLARGENPVLITAELVLRRIS